MTTREEIIAAAKEAGFHVEEDGSMWEHNDYVEQDDCGMHDIGDKVNHLYSIAHEAGAASRDAEIAQLNKEAAEKFSALAKEYDQLRAELEYDQRNAAMSQSESARLLDENTKLRAELAASLAACKAKDAAIREARNWNWLDDDAGNIPVTEDIQHALLLQPDDSALKAWLGKPVAWEYADAFGTHYTDDRRDWMDTPGIESVTCLYSPKGLK